MKMTLSSDSGGLDEGNMLAALRTNIANRDSLQAAWAANLFRKTFHRSYTSAPVNGINFSSKEMRGAGFEPANPYGTGS
jgi:hypothetical protein